MGNLADDARTLVKSRITARLTNDQEAMASLQPKDLAELYAVVAIQEAQILGMVMAHAIMRGETPSEYWKKHCEISASMEETLKGFRL